MNKLILLVLVYHKHLRTKKWKKESLCTQKKRRKTIKKRETFRSNEDPKIVIDFAAACIIPYKSNIVFSVPEKHGIYYWNGLEMTSFIGSGDEGNNDGCAKKCKLFQPTGLAIEFDNVYLCC